MSRRVTRKSRKNDHSEVLAPRIQPKITESVTIPLDPLLEQVVPVHNSVTVNNGTVFQSFLTNDVAPVPVVTQVHP